MKLPRDEPLELPWERSEREAREQAEQEERAELLYQRRKDREFEDER